MIKYQRTKNSIRNTKYGILYRLINLFGAFLARTMLIRILGVEYAGLDGLFASILTMLNMAELGFSSAVVFKLYKPIAEKNEKQVCALLNYYKKVYRTIGIVVFAVGIAILPFLNILVKSQAPDNVNIRILYLIYLTNTCLSYWLFAYKTALIHAHQRNDLASKVSSATFLAKYIVQILSVLLLHNYYAYAVIVPLTTILTNIGNLLITRKYYPQYQCKGNIDDADRKEIKQKVGALLFNKVGVAIINGSDNIVISSFLGLTTLGIYDSYYYIFNMLHSFFDVFHSSITGGIGNSIITESVEKNYQLYKRLTFLNAWIVGWCSICLLCLYEPFIKLWVGHDKAFPWGFSIVMSVYFYLWMIRFITLIFKNAQGLWMEDRFRAIIEGFFNLFLNLIMVRIIGIYGITISTIIAMIVVSIPWETHVLFSKYFLRSEKEYYLILLKNIAITALAGAVTYFFCIQFKGKEIIELLVRALICIIVPNVILYFINRRSDEFDFAKTQMMKLIIKVMPRRD